MKTSLLFALSLLFAGGLCANGLERIPWAWEDHNGDHVWNYSHTNDNFQSYNPWGNIPLTADAYEGHSALFLRYLNVDQTDNFAQAFGFATIPTANANSGTEPTYDQEYLDGKDLRYIDALEFFIKGSSGANRSALSVSISSPNGHSSRNALLKDYVQISDAWQRVVVPMADFMPAFNNFDRFQLWNVNEVVFRVDQNDNNVPFEVTLDNISFLRYPEVAEFKWAYEETNVIPSLNLNGAWNYSWSRWDEGSVYIPANDWHDLKTSLTEAYQGQSSLEVRYEHRHGGYIDLYLSTHPNGQGVEPSSFYERDLPKDLSAYNTLRFFIKTGDQGYFNGDITLDLIETPFRNANPVKLSDYLFDWALDDWTEVRIPLADLTAATSDLRRIKEIWIRFNDNASPSSGVFYLDNIGFINVVEQGVAMEAKRHWWLSDTLGNGEYNYSTTAMADGSRINVANQWQDVVIGSFFTGPYGEYEVSAIDLQFSHNGSGYAAANLTTSVENTGVEPTGFVDRDFGKSVANLNTYLTFRGQVHGELGLKVRLVDIWGHVSKAVAPSTYRLRYARYMASYYIPTYVFDTPGFNFHEVKAIQFFVDQEVPAGEIGYKIFGLQFARY